MTASLWDWPALDLAGRPAPERLEVGRAVWGKVHGAASDFRWIACTRGLDPQGRRLELELFLGSEDAPRQAVFWRVLGGSYCAVSCYPSRAMDAARRSGFLEKQLLHWAPAGEAPTALGALLLLPLVARSTDAVWWPKSSDPGWAQPDFALSLKPEPPAGVGEEDLARNAQRGLTALREAVEETALAAFYSAVLAGCRPAVLSGLGEPLPPEGVAALLLPLSRHVADRLSVAGWNVSHRVDPETFRRLWHVLLCDRAPAALRTASEPAVTEQGREAARAIFADDPSRLAQPPAGAAGRSASPAGLPPVLERLRSFAKDPLQRWLGPEDLFSGLDRPSRSPESCTGLLVEWTEALDDEIRALAKESGLRRWRREHLQVKADVLRAAALALAPSTVEPLGLPRSGRVPALLFYPQLGEVGRSQLAGLGKATFHQAVEQSLACRPNRFGAAVQRWLERREERRSSSLP